MKFNDLKIGDNLVCLRIKDDIAIHFNLKITAKALYSFSVISDTLDTYTFTVPTDKKVNGKIVLLDNGSDNFDESIREYLFETLEDCKKFAINYYEQKIEKYEETIQRVKTW